MNPQQGSQSRSSSNGYGRRRVDREMGPRIESKIHSGKPILSNSHSGLANGGKGGGAISSSCDRLIYVMACLIGQPVEVHVRNGSVISGIFHASNAAKDFGIVLKMARVTKDGSMKEQKPAPIFVKKPETMIIPARELVQVLAKDVPLNNDELTNGHARDRRQDLLIDSSISQSQHVELERELKPWTPDKDVPECPELENIFDGAWNRNWDQFQTNEALFGVKSTFNEELYTTKLERGPQMREREREATRLAREILEEDTKDLHLAEERGIHFHSDFDVDEEMRFSAVQRDVDSKENENSVLDTYNSEQYRATFNSTTVQSYSDISRKKPTNQGRTSSSSSSLDEVPCSQGSADLDMNLSDSSDHLTQPSHDGIAKRSPCIGDDDRLDEVQIKDQDEKKTSLDNFIRGAPSEEGSHTLKSDDGQPPSNVKGLSPSAAAFAPPVQETKHRPSEPSELAVTGKMSTSTEPSDLSLRPCSSASSASERLGAGSVSTCPGLSPSSSMGSLSSEKSTLNPHAKEFKLNPNAKSFTPSTLRPHASASETSCYYASNMPAVPMHSLPMGIGIGSFGGPPTVLYNPQAAQGQPPQAYIHPNGPLFAQQMMLGQPRPVVYMSGYPPDTPYKGRNF
ncbi:Protein interacting with poly(A)-binding protein [Dioscorea alata]|uniref:Protein interacting with poly(A)-binding protein n=1 Tax=Dioscorea alata TaxID=55571 RepID=A0ACB7U8F3_DIOAL|nr:Protein interacting with poly(A)-binding protein [Dioscorea alata]